MTATLRSLARTGSGLTLAFALAAALWPAAGAAGGRESPSLESEQAAIARWRAERVESLTGDGGWLTLAGLFWLKEGDNTFGRAPGNSLALDNAALADTAGSFVLSGHQVRFVARPGSGVSHDGRPVTTLDLAPDTSGAPTVLASGALRFYVIERAGNLGVRVRDLANPHRTGFRGLEYFPVSTDWVVDARFERYQPAHHIRIVNILGMELEMESPGALVFTKAGHEWRLDTVLEEPGDRELFIMFADATSGHETYGAGRFLYIPMPQGATVAVDFNKAYNPPCALNEFATCPLPPWQNRLKLRVAAGEKKYAGGTDRHL
ncbi:MAG TPA: DUF1684 domain-containing protein [Steroidobacteraceae bacterium]|nr:DUF1684 domain-containing protein [Steroidobacteraceae bacterium]